MSPEARDLLDWEVRWESALTSDELAELTGFLARVFPGHRGGIHQGWAGERPELRLIGRAPEGALVAHIGILRRFLRVRGTGESLLVGDVGLVSVDPGRQGGGLGRALMDRTHDQLAELGVDFGTLTTGEARVGFYEAVGWTRASNPVLHAIDLWNESESFTGPLLYRPVSGRVWPDGELERNGREI